MISSGISTALYGFGFKNWPSPKSWFLDYWSGRSLVKRIPSMRARHGIHGAYHIRHAGGPLPVHTPAMTTAGAFPTFLVHPQHHPLHGRPGDLFTHIRGTLQPITHAFQNGQRQQRVVQQKQYPGSTLPSIVYPLDVPMSDFVPSHPGRK